MLLEQNCESWDDVEIEKKLKKKTHKCAKRAEDSNVYENKFIFWMNIFRQLSIKKFHSLHPHPHPQERQHSKELPEKSVSFLLPLPECWHSVYTGTSELSEQGETDEEKMKIFTIPRALHPSVLFSSCCNLLHSASLVRRPAWKSENQSKESSFYWTKNKQEGKRGRKLWKSRYCAKFANSNRFWSLQDDVGRGRRKGLKDLICLHSSLNFA